MNALESFLEPILEFDSISLKELDRVRLLNRTDTKFLFHPSKLGEVLNKIRPHYKVLEIDGVRIFQYDTLYLDTNDLLFYHHHHAGKQNRHKVRFRTYVESKLCFLEIKFKNNKGRTVKNRMIVEGPELALSEESKRFIGEIAGIESELLPAVINRFSRITLAHLYGMERVTFDLDLHFEKNNESLDLSHVAIAEVKQEKYNRQSPVMIALKEAGVYEDSLSKYCTGMAMLHPHLKQNQFKSKLIRIKRLQNEL